MMRCTCVVYVWQKGASVIRENTNWRAPEMLCLRRPLVRDWKLYASSPAGRSGGSLIFGTRCLTATPPPGRPHRSAAPTLHHPRPSPPRGSHCTEAERFTPNQSRVHRFRKIRPGVLSRASRPIRHRG